MSLNRSAFTSHSVWMRFPATSTGEDALARVIPDKTMAAYIALQFWYSVFLPAEHLLYHNFRNIALLMKRAYDQGFESLVINSFLLAKIHR